MTRIKRGTIKNKRHKKVLKEARGYRGSRSRTFKSVKQQLLKSLSYAYRDRKNNKRNFRRLWITRINAAARINGLSYNEFINGLKKASVEVPVERIDRNVIVILAGTDLQRIP